MAPDDPLSIERGALADVDRLAPLYEQLRAHHEAVAPEQPLLRDRRLSWQRRRALYRQRLAYDTGVLLIAQVGARPLGYAFVLLEHGGDDTYDVGDPFAELYSLVVAGDVRGQGIGTRLLDTLDAELERLRIGGLRVGVLVDNASALRLYARRGLVPSELYLYRVNGSAQPE
jgi:ribosomal protein S18 acetylase RimI-like enzyme